MRIILDCRDASTVPSVLDLLTLMDQDHPAPDRKYVDALCEFYESGIEDVLDVFDTPCALLASLGELGIDTAYQLHDYTRDKLLLPLGLLETGLKVELGDEEVVSKDQDSSIVEVGGRQRSIIEVGDSSVVEVEGWCSVIKAGDDSSIVELAVPETLPQAPVVVRGSIKQSIEDKEDIVEEKKRSEEEGEEEDEEEDWPEEDGGSMGEYFEERISDWLVGVREAGENEETESDVSHEV